MVFLCIGWIDNQIYFAASLVEFIFSNLTQLQKKLELDALDSRGSKRRVCFISKTNKH